MYRRDTRNNTVYSPTPTPTAIDLLLPPLRRSITTGQRFVGDGDGTTNRWRDCCCYGFRKLMRLLCLSTVKVTVTVEVDVDSC
mmetsp:Transcript_35066/g.35590  ORF Transcript_35066/g.35590 Transcript_35066/m.35590 type:complete len:83 (+) Transcript_35066:179-427(+)